MRLSQWQQDLKKKEFGVCEVDMKVTIYSDGSARGNPDGPGGYGTVIQYVDAKGVLHEKEINEGYDKTTNNLKLLTDPARLIFTLILSTS